MSGYITRFEFARTKGFPTSLVPLEVNIVAARQTRAKLLAFWFTAGCSDLIAVWDAASEQAVQMIVDQVTGLGGITCETVYVSSDEELAEAALARQYLPSWR